MMTNEQFERFIANLKILNAKERDHLMRYAYLGTSEKYDETKCFLSPEFSKQLQPHLTDLGLNKFANCMFAGMDYHLDWLYVALRLAIEMPDFKINDTLPSDIPKDIFKMEPAPLGDPLYSDFRALTGSQEDIDLIAVFKDESDYETKYAILIIEAKGRAAFNRVQLARKLIRLDHILKISGAVSLIKYRLILSAPNDKLPFDDCRKFAQNLPMLKLAESDKFDLMRKALSPENHLSKIGEGLHYLQIPFPEITWAIVRERDIDSGPFTQWGFAKR